MWTTNPKKALSKLRFDYLRKTKNNVPLRVAINLKIKIKQRKNQKEYLKNISYEFSTKKTHQKFPETKNISKSTQNQ